MLTVIDLAKSAGVTTDTVRHYARIGLLSPKKDSQNGYKQFKPNDIQRVQFIRRAKSLGFSLKEIKQVLSDAELGNSPCPKVREIIQKHIVENRQKLQKLLELQNRMEAALIQWETMPDGTPDGHSVCHLIEAIDATVQTDE